MMFLIVSFHVDVALHIRSAHADDAQSLILTTSVALTAALPVSLDPRTAGQKFLASQAAANNLLDGKGAGIDVHKYYSGDGSADAGWPKMSDWVSFQNM